MGFWADMKNAYDGAQQTELVKQQQQAASAPNEWGSLFGEHGTGAGIPLGTARWMSPDAAAEKYRYSGSLFDKKIWVGEGFDAADSPLGYEDDRHVCLVSGSRGGKGVGVIVPNLCFWPGSSIIVDPKGENATVTAQRRGAGSAYAHAMGQRVCILDPFGEVQLPDALRARYNPLDAIDPKSDFAIDDAGRVAAALVVIENRNDPYWEEAARNLIKGLILHVLSAPYLAGKRNLISVRRLLTQGDWLTAETLRQGGEEDIPSAFELLWSRMRRNTAFNGVVAGVGEQMIAMAEKQRSGVMEAARTNTEFLDSTPMQRLLAQSDFDLGGLKTEKRGLTIYLTLPARYMETHFRWLRLMITLAVGEMERIKGRPATGHPTLFLLDEFAGLKRMEVIEHAAAQAAGFGIKFLFVVQNLPQLEDLYEKSWETFLGNSGLKLFFQIDDDFTRSYLSRQLGDLETLRQTRSASQSRSTSFSDTSGTSWSENDGGGMTRSPWLGWRKARQESWGRSTSDSKSTSRGTSDSTTDGWGEAAHKRPLLNPDEIGRLLARISDRKRPGYPGVALALIPGEFPVLARRVNYFESSRFLGYFDPHPNHPPPLTLAELAARARQREEAEIPRDPEPKPAPVSRPRRKMKTQEKVACVVMGILAVLYLLSLVAPSAPSGRGATSAAYAQGVADWDRLREWIQSQDADRRAGIDYWSENRNVPGHANCAQAAADYSGDQRQFAFGCQQAARLLGPIDARRRDPEYRSGFTDESHREPL